MDIKALVKKITSPTPIIGVSAILLFSLSFLIYESLNESASGQLQFWINIIGSIGVLILLFFFVIHCYILSKQFRKNEVGSRLTTKLVVIYLVLTLIPFSLIYYFSIQFLNKGVDSWFDVRVEQAVQDALLLGQTSLEAIQEEITTDVEKYAKSLPKNSDPRQLLKTLENIRTVEGYAELSLYTDDGRLLIFSSEESGKMLPDLPGDEVFSELRFNQTYTSLEPISNNTQKFRVVAPIRSTELGQDFFALQAIKFLPLRYAKLASSVETALSQYDQMLFSRGPLKFSLIVTLSLISLASLLFSLLTAVYLSKRLVQPISNLAIGTKTIAEGNYSTKLPVTTADELGILTESFNEMSGKIEDAQQATIASQIETEEQRSYLEAVLTNLSSGVLALDDQQNLLMSNSAANEILGVQLDQGIGKPIQYLSELRQPIDSFIRQVESSIQAQRDSWQEECTLLGQHGRQILILRGTVLNIASKQSPQSKHYLVVFDDITNLIQAQRDAAWGEVAKRLAHEIKNPLTPIQLSAERIRNKFSSHVDGELKQALERSTRTIVQQVESMKEMVNAFSSYAQPVRAALEPLNVNQLICDVIDLHASSLQTIQLELELDENLPTIKANSSALRQVLNNLFINASHALVGKSDGKLLVKTSRADQNTGNYIDIVVKDNGSGIPADIKESMFDPYVSSKTKGSGLGLAIVKRIVEEHSGSVWVSEGFDVGTTMNLRLPINAMQTYRGNRGQNPLQSETDFTIDKQA